MKAFHWLIGGVITVCASSLWAGNLDVHQLWEKAVAAHGTGVGAAEYDLSLYFLSQFFGSAGGVLASGAVPTYLQVMFYYFNVGLMLFAGAVVSIGVALSVLNTAREGRMMGQNEGAATFFIRAIGAMALLTPSSALGYMSLIQCLVLWTVVQGVNVANFVWNVTQDTLNTSGMLFSPSIEDVVENSDEQLTQLNVLSTDALSFATHLLQDQMCYYAALSQDESIAADYEQLESSDGGTSRGGLYVLHPPTGIEGDEWAFGGLSYDFSNSNLAGSIGCLSDVHLASSYPDALSDDSAKTTWRTEQYIAFASLFESMDQLASKLKTELETNPTSPLSCSSDGISVSSSTTCDGLYDLLTAARNYSVALTTLASTVVSVDDSSDEVVWSEDYYITDPTVSITGSLLATANDAIEQVLLSDDLTTYGTEVTATYFATLWDAYYSDPSSVPSDALSDYCSALGLSSSTTPSCSSDTNWFLLGMPTTKMRDAISTDNFNNLMAKWATALVVHGNVGSEVQAVVKDHALAYMSQPSNEAPHTLGSSGWITAGAFFQHMMSDTTTLADGITPTYPTLSIGSWDNDAYSELSAYADDLQSAVLQVVDVTGSTYNNLQSGAYLYSDSYSDFSSDDSDGETESASYSSIVSGNRAYLVASDASDNQTFSVSRNLMVYYMREAMLSLMPSGTASIESDYLTLSGIVNDQEGRQLSLQTVFNCAGLFGAGWFGWLPSFSDTSNDCDGSLSGTSNSMDSILGLGWTGYDTTTSTLGTIKGWDSDGGLACSEGLSSDCQASAVDASGLDNVVDAFSAGVYADGTLSSSDDDDETDSDDATTTSSPTSSGDTSTQAFVDSDIQVFMFQVLKTWIQHVGLNPAPINPMHELSSLGFDLIAAGYNYIIHVVQDVWFVNMSLKLISYVDNITGLILSSVARNVASVAIKYPADEMVESGEPITMGIGWAIKAIAAGVIGWADGVASKAQFYEIAYPAKLFASTMHVTIALFSGIPMILLGTMFAFYIPLLPFLAFSFTAIGWFLTVIEAVLSAPLIALGVASPTGHDLLGQSEKVIMLLVGVFIRPVAITIGFVMAAILTYGAFAMVNFLLTNVLASYLTQHVMSQVDGFAFVNYMIVFIFVFFYGLIMMEVIVMVFSLVYRLPNYLGRWVGAPREETGEEAALSSVHSRVESSIEGLVNSAGGSVDSVGSSK